MILALINWVVIALALYGAYLNAKQDIRGFIFWTITNVWLTSWNLYIGEYPQAMLFLAYTIITVKGYITWRKNLSFEKKTTTQPQV